MTSEPGKEAIPCTYCPISTEVKAIRLWHCFMEKSHTTGIEETIAGPPEVKIEHISGWRV